MDAGDGTGIQEQEHSPGLLAEPEPLATPGPGARVQTPLQALLRQREYLRPYYLQLVVMLVVALVATGTEIAIPLLAKAAIDGPIAVAAAAKFGEAHKYGVLIVIGIAALAL